MISVTRKTNFNAAHRLHNPNWSDEKNEQFYGLCNNKNYHGHNYELEVTITGTIDSESGYLIDLKYLGDLIENVQPDSPVDTNLKSPGVIHLSSSANTS